GNSPLANAALWNCQHTERRQVKSPRYWTSRSVPFTPICRMRAKSSVPPTRRIRSWKHCATGRSGSELDELPERRDSGKHVVHRLFTGDGSSVSAELPRHRLYVPKPQTRT